VADALPERKYLVNLCSDRYRFAVGLAAALLRGQVSLLPPAQTPELMRTLKQGYAGLYALSDTPPGSVVQFERLGYFAHDPDTPLLFHRTVGLRDEWANIQKRA